MRSILDALQEGRLVELPEYNKADALEFLALLIEAIPDIGNRSDLVKSVQEREAQFNTDLGNGVAVPHCRVNYDGELQLAIGWSPSGIDYGAKDGKKVNMLFMYYVPDNQRNTYLKEVSGLAKVLTQTNSLDALSHMSDIQEVRDYLLDWIAKSIDAAVPDAKARMIQLDARHTILETMAAQTATSLPESVARFIPFKMVHFGTHLLILTADNQLADTLEKSDDFKQFDVGSNVVVSGYNIAILSETHYSHSRKLIEAVAYRMG
jgi:mannitol/fructose-specific phosphotransferase system IIA component (Ntr-type)